MLLDRIISFFTSLRLTVFCLAAALVLVFAGTIAQVHLGLYVTQERYFHSLFVMWSPEGASWKVPVWPGGYLIGAVLLVNLIAAHIKRFTFTAKKIGLFLTHAGLILLFVGQFLTESFQVESFMRLEEGETKNYTESSRKNELVLVDATNPDRDQVISIPESRLAEKGELKHPALPFSIRVKEYLPNSRPAPALASVAEGMKRVEASQGVGQRLRFAPSETTSRMDDENVPTALIEIVTPKGSLGTWTVSNWLTKYPGNLRSALGAQGAALLDTPQQFSYENKTYKLALRPVRYYLPYNLTLQDFTHKRYKGTEIPKDFSSRVQLKNPQTGENREVLIYMNNPLRYAGMTFYQGGFEPGDTVSILQVVRNPAWLTPYLSCTMVGVGLMIHFLIHLVQFGKRRSQSPPSPGASIGSRKPAAGPKNKEASHAALATAAFSTALPLTSKRRTS
jgi:hypothetical protein